MPDLTDTERGILDFEATWYLHPGAKDTEIHARFGLTPTLYYAQLNRLVDRPEALAYAPLVVKRLTRLRARRRQQRSSRRLSM